MTALLVVGHGTRSAAGVAQFEALLRRVRRRAEVAGLGIPAVEGGLIELAPPPVTDAVAALVAAGYPTFAAVPLVLVSAGHAKGDIPAVLAAQKQRFPHLSYRYGRPLGPHPSLLSLLEARLDAALRAEPADRAGTAVLLVGRGSTDPDANAEIHKVARLFWEGRGLAMVEPAFVSLTAPGVADGLARCRRLGAHRIVVLPYFLFDGVLPERIVAHSTAWAAGHPDTEVRVAGLIGDCDELADLVLERYAEALSVDLRMNCDTCLYRVAMPGFADKVGAPQRPHDHPHDPTTHRDHHPPSPPEEDLVPARLRHHGDAELAPGLADLAVNVRRPAPPGWLRARLAASLSDLAAYPNPRRARAVVGARHGRAPTEVLLTAGAAEAFVLAARSLRPDRAVVVHPQFTEPEAALRAAGHRVERLTLSATEGFTLDPKRVPVEADLVVVGNPTNPTSVLHPADTLAALARPGRVLLVDEAFADCVPGEAASVAGRADLPGLVVVRSLTKTWALAGLRVGYLLAAPELVARFAAAQPVWAVSAPALVAAEVCSGPAALAEAEEEAVRLVADRDHLCRRLAGLPGVSVVAEPRASFVLVRVDPRAAEVPGGPTVRVALRERGFAVRRGETFPGLGPDWLRIAVRDPAISDALAEVLAEVLGRGPGTVRTGTSRKEPAPLLGETIEAIRPTDPGAAVAARDRQDRLTKPPGSLGALEEVSVRLAGLAGSCPPPAPTPAAVAVFAADHGVCAQGVTRWPQEVTAQMVANFLAGGAVVNAFAAQVGATVRVVDVGVAAPLAAHPGLLPRKVRAGTADLSTGPAMSRGEAVRALEVGILTARELVAEGHRCLLTGDMGIANTTASAALVAVFTDTPPIQITGLGAGINPTMLTHKITVIEQALDRHRPDPTDPVGVLAAVGGLEHAALAGFILGAAATRTPVVLDGVIAGAAALAAVALCPEAANACLAGHRSAEPGHQVALDHLGLRPLLDLGLRLGEGTGALLALPLVQAAARTLREVATFDGAGVHAAVDTGPVDTGAAAVGAASNREATR